jgi:ATP-binding cassette, subfamily C (CFTR/MRP), member 1
MLGVYLFFSLLFDAARVRTLWLIKYDGGIRGVFTASLVMKVIILLLEAKGKRRYFNSSDRQKGPEETSGIFSQSVFWWLNNLISRGFSKVLLMDDLYPIDDEMLSEKLGANFRQMWETCKFLQS